MKHSTHSAPNPILTSYGPALYMLTLLFLIGFCIFFAGCEGNRGGYVHPIDPLTPGTTRVPPVDDNWNGYTPPDPVYQAPSSVAATESTAQTAPGTASRTVAASPGWSPPESQTIDTIASSVAEQEPVVTNQSNQILIAERSLRSIPQSPPNSSSNAAGSTRSASAGRSGLAQLGSNAAARAIASPQLTRAWQQAGTSAQTDENMTGQEPRVVRQTVGPTPVDRLRL